MIVFSVIHNVGHYCTYSDFLCNTAFTIFNKPQSTFTKDKNNWERKPLHTEMLDF